jgi:uncharacterized protein YjbI with pentapeptide repeats
MSPVEDANQYTDPATRHVRGDLPRVADRPFWQRSLSWQSVTIRTGAALLATAVLTLLLGSLTLLPSMFVPDPAGQDLARLGAAERLSALNDVAQTRNAVRTTLVQAVGGSLFLVTAFLGWRQVQTARQGQVTERFSRSIDQLGDEKTDVRMGGIFALSQISEVPHYTAPIAQILAAYLRTHSSSLREKGGRAAALPHADQRGPAVTGDKHSHLSEPDQGRPGALEGARRSDLQAVLQILIVEDLWGRAELGRLDLSFVSIPYARLRHVNLQGSALLEAELPSGDFTGSDFSGSDMRASELAGSLLHQTIMDGADLTSAVLMTADCTGSTFVDTNLLSADLRRCWLTRADMTLADLERADLSGAKLTGATLRRTRLVGAIMVGCDASRAKFIRTDLKRADLRGTKFTDATLERVDLAGARFDHETDFAGAVIDEISLHQIPKELRPRVGVESTGGKARHESREPPAQPML